MKPILKSIRNILLTTVALLNTATLARDLSDSDRSSGAGSQQHPTQTQHPSTLSTRTSGGYQENRLRRQQQSQEERRKNINEERLVRARAEAKIKEDALKIERQEAERKRILGEFNAEVVKRNQIRERITALGSANQLYGRTRITMPAAITAIDEIAANTIVTTTNLRAENEDLLVRLNRIEGFKKETEGRPKA